MNVAEFLLARIAEDESNDTTLIGVARKDWAARWAAECEAKREIVGLLSDAEQLRSPDMGWHFMKAAVRALALPYADHPDYQQEWKP